MGAVNHSLSLGIFQPFFWTNGRCAVPRCLRFNYYRDVPARRLLCQEHQAYVDARLSHSMVNLPLMDDDYGDWPWCWGCKGDAFPQCQEILVYVDPWFHRDSTGGAAPLGLSGQNHWALYFDLISIKKPNHLPTISKFHYGNYILIHFGEQL